MMMVRYLLHMAYVLFLVATFLIVVGMCDMTALASTTNYNQTQYCCLKTSNKTQTNANNTLNGITGITFGSSTPSFIIKDGSPLQQSLHGTAPKDVTCKQGLHLILKLSDGSPACVKPNTVNVLIERGWAKTS